MRWPWCPAPRAGTLLAEQTRKKCCVVWTNRAAGGLPVGRSLVSFYPGWDGSLETDLSMWHVKARKDSDCLLKGKHFLSLRLLVWTTCAVSQLFENTSFLCQQTFHGWCSMKGARCWGGQITAALSLPSHHSHSFLQPKEPPSAPPPFPFPGQDSQALSEQVQGASLPCDVSVLDEDSQQSLWGLGWKRPLAQRYQAAQFSNTHTED